MGEGRGVRHSYSVMRGEIHALLSITPIKVQKWKNTQKLRQIQLTDVLARCRMKKRDSSNDRAQASRECSCPFLSSYYRFSVRGFCIPDATAPQSTFWKRENTALWASLRHHPSYSVPLPNTHANIWEEWAVWRMGGKQTGLLSNRRLHSWRPSLWLVSNTS